MLSVISSDGCVPDSGTAIQGTVYTTTTSFLAQTSCVKSTSTHCYRIILSSLSWTKSWNRGGSSSSSAWHLSINTRVTSPCPNTGSPKSKPNNVVEYPSYCCLSYGRLIKYPPHLCAIPSPWHHVRYVLVAVVASSVSQNIFSPVAPGSSSLRITPIFPA